MPVNPCPSPCPPPTLGVVSFLQSEFVALYPEFTGISAGANQNAFTVATLLLDNTCGSRVQDANVRLSLLYMLTAHVSFLQNGTNDGAGNVNTPPGVVGRIANATEGSVSVGVEWDANAGPSQAYFVQTKYGATFWQATAGFRTMFYIPAPRRGPNGPGFPFGSFGGLVDIE